VARLNIRSWCCLDAQGIVELLVMVAGLVAMRGEYCTLGGVWKVSCRSGWWVFAGALLGPEATRLWCGV
jgi:hypothetical protein